MVSRFPGPAVALDGPVPDLLVGYIRSLLVDSNFTSVAVRRRVRPA